MIDRLAERYGYRGLWLFAMGALWCLIGVGALLTPEAPVRSWVLFDLVPAIYRAPVWLVTGLVAIWQGTRGPVADDSKGHVALFLMPAVTIFSFALSGVAFGVTWCLVRFGTLDTVSGWPGAFYAVLIWAVLSSMLALGVRWPNPSPPPPVPACPTEGGR